MTCGLRALTGKWQEILTAHEPAVSHSPIEETITMTKRTMHTALLALLVGGSAVAPLEGQIQEEGAPAVQNEDAPDRAGELVTVYVTNDSFSDMRIYVVETAFSRRSWRLGYVTGLSRARFEIPDFLGAEQGNLVLVAVALGSRERQSTGNLLTWPGALVDWRIASTRGQSFAWTH